MTNGHRFHVKMVEGTLYKWGIMEMLAIVKVILIITVIPRLGLTIADTRDGGHISTAAQTGELLMMAVKLVGQWLTGNV